MQLSSADKAEIEWLSAEYNRLCDNGYEADGLAELFVPDGEWRTIAPDGADDMGNLKGREEIREFFSDFSKRPVRALHTTMNAQIESLDDGRVRGHWSGLTLLMEGKTMRFRASTRSDQYVRYAGRWKFESRTTRLLIDESIQTD